MCDPDIQNEINGLSETTLYIFRELMQDDSHTILLFYQWIDGYVANSRSS